ncbi:hypothetical protein VUR80DRAFT_3384 [Thermomyces stellatus]
MHRHGQAHLNKSHELRLPAEIFFGLGKEPYCLSKTSSGLSRLHMQVPRHASHTSHHPCSYLDSTGEGSPKCRPPRIPRPQQVQRHTAIKAIPPLYRIFLARSILAWAANPVGVRESSSVGDQMSPPAIVRSSGTTRRQCKLTSPGNGEGKPLFGA